MFRLVYERAMTQKLDAKLNRQMHRVRVTTVYLSSSILTVVGPPKSSREARLEQREAGEAMYDDRRSEETD